MNQEILQDVNKRGKKRPWRPKKQQTMVLSYSLHRLGQPKKANRVWWCGAQLTFRVEVETLLKKLESANFCRERLCPMCAWRKSLKVFYQVGRVMDEVEKRHENLVPIFLTLTVRNCKGEELGETIDQMFKGWKDFAEQRAFRERVHGWFRALEVTYNAETDTYHPHFHAVLLVDKQYFKSKKYLETSGWVRMWRVACKLDYDPICDVRRVRRGKHKHKAVAEVAKYTLKDSEYLHDADCELTDRLVGTLGDALRNRRLFAFGGVMKKIAKELGADRLDEGSLVNIDDAAIRDDVASMLVTYHWDFGLIDYLRRR
jgi:plasmid rolling circle replication initiator protein Rep